MAASALAPLLMGAGGAAAGGAAAGGLLSSGLFGSILSGAASGWMKSMGEKKAEERQIAEEKRRAGQYAGLGEAVRFWDDGAQGQGQDAPAQKIAAAPALGQNPDMIGQKYKERAERNQTKVPKYRYDRKTGMVETG